MEKNTIDIETQIRALGRALDKTMTDFDDENDRMDYILDVTNEYRRQLGAEPPKKGLFNNSLFDNKEQLSWQDLVERFYFFCILVGFGVGLMIGISCVIFLGCNNA